MLSSLPNTPYFRGLTTTDLLDVSISGEVLLLDDRVDFSKPSRLRRDRIAVRRDEEKNTVFYVSLEEIRQSYRQFALILQRGIVTAKAEDFEALLRHLCPSTNGRYPEPLTSQNLLPLFRISHQLELEQISQECRRFIYGSQIKQLTIAQMIEIFNFLMEEDVDREEDEIGNALNPGKSCLLAALLEYEDQNDLFCLMLNGCSSPCVLVLKKAMKQLHKLEHTTSFINSTSPIRCNCPKEETSGMRLFERRSRASTPFSLCGLICSDCHRGFCSKCRKTLCPVKINQLLLSHEEELNEPETEEEEEELDISTEETFAYPSSSPEDEDDFRRHLSSQDRATSTPLAPIQTPIYSNQVLLPPQPVQYSCYPPQSQPIYVPMAAPPPPPGFHQRPPVLVQNYAPVYGLQAPLPPVYVPVQSAPCIQYSQPVYQPLPQFQYSYSYL